MTKGTQKQKTKLYEIFLNDVSVGTFNSNVTNESEVLAEAKELLKDKYNQFILHGNITTQLI